MASLLQTYRKLKRQNHALGKPCRIYFSMPHLKEHAEPGGVAQGHYFHQDLLVAQRIFKRQPVRHLDVGSRVDGFVAHVATFREIEVLDIRPVPTSTTAIHFRQMDIMALPAEMQACCDSLSCLHALEHFGLGRYGDSVDLYGHLKGLQALTNMLKPGSTLYLAVPIGPERIDFNANRVFAIQTILTLISAAFELQEFAYVDDNGMLHENVVLQKERMLDNYGCQYGCGIFILHRK